MQTSSPLAALSSSQHNPLRLLLFPGSPRCITISPTFLSWGITTRLTTFRVICGKQYMKSIDFFFFLDSKGRKYVKRSYLNAKTQSSDVIHDYFSRDDVAFFVGKLLLCYRFTRNVFCFLTLKNVL